VAILTLNEHKRLKWSRDKHNTERQNMLSFRVMACLSLRNEDKSHIKLAQHSD